MPVLSRNLHHSFTRSPNCVVVLRLRRDLSTTTCRSRDSQYYRTDFQSQNAGFSAPYDPDAPTIGPLSQASKHGTLRLTPVALKEHLDKFVVGQDKAKKVVSVAIFNHYQRIRELRRLEAEEQAKREQELRRETRERESRSHPVESTLSCLLNFTHHDQLRTTQMNSPATSNP